MDVPFRALINTELVHLLMTQAPPPPVELGLMNYESPTLHYPWRGYGRQYLHGGKYTYRGISAVRDMTRVLRIFFAEKFLPLIIVILRDIFRAMPVRTDARG